MDNDESGQERKNWRFNRRQFLQASGALTAAGVTAGCSGGGSDGSGSDGSGSDGSGSDGSGSDGGISKPWTTEDLAQKAQEEGGEFMLYTSSGVEEVYQFMFDKIKEKYPWFSPEVFKAKGTKVSQRFMQEKQAGRVQADMVMSVSDLGNTMDKLDKYYTSGNWSPENYAVLEDVNEELYTEPGHMMQPFSVAPATFIMYHTEQATDAMVSTMNELGHNGWLEPELEGAVVAQDYTPQWKSFGYLIDYHAKKADMEPAKWLQAVDDNIEMSWAGGHSDSVRKMAAGGGQFVMNDYTHHLEKFADLPVDGVFWEDAPRFADSKSIKIVKESSNKWAARFFGSIVMEPWFQREVLTADDDDMIFWPGRPDLEYSGLDPLIERLMSQSFRSVGTEERMRLEKLGQEAYKATWGEPGHQDCGDHC